MLRFEVVIPAYREELTIRASLERLIATLDQFSVEYRLHLVVDGQVDDTATVARAVSDPRLRIHEYGTNRGKGFALRFGSSFVTAPVCVYFDADLDLDPVMIPSMVRHVEHRMDTVVVGSKVHGQSVVQYPAFRRFQSAVMRRITVLLLGVQLPDTQTGLKAFPSDRLQLALQSVHSDGFAFDVELLLTLHDGGSAITDHPVVLDYKFGSSTSPRAVVVVLRELISIRRRRRKKLS